MDINDLMKEEVKFLDSMGVSHTAMAENSGINRRTIEAWLYKEDARLQRKNEEKMKEYLRQVKESVVMNMKPIPDRKFLDNDK